MSLRGRVHLLGDDVDTDLLAPGRYMKLPVEQLATHCLEDLRPGFAAAVRPGDLLLAGRNFGIGSSREQAAEALRHLGIAAVVARSFGSIFYRNAINLGLPVLRCPQLEGLAEGDRVTLDVTSGLLRRDDPPLLLQAEPLPPALRSIIADGGLVPHLERRFSAAGPARS